MLDSKASSFRTKGSYLSDWDWIPPRSFPILTGILLLPLFCPVLLQKVILKLDLHDDKDKQKVLKAVSTLHGTLRTPLHPFRCSVSWRIASCNENKEFSFAIQICMIGL